MKKIKTNPCKKLFLYLAWVSPVLLFFFVANMLIGFFKASYEASFLLVDLPLLYRSVFLLGVPVLALFLYRKKLNFPLSFKISSILAVIYFIHNFLLPLLPALRDYTVPYLSASYIIGFVITFSLELFLALFAIIFYAGASNSVKGSWKWLYGIWLVLGILSLAFNLLFSFLGSFV